MNRRALLAALGSGTAAGLSGCSSVLNLSGGDPCDGESCDIGMTRTEFVPETYEVRVGETVVWKNTSEAVHTVTAYEELIPDDATYFATGGFENQADAYDAWGESRGGRLGTRETFEHTFDVPGTYEYVCIPHERAEMKGTIVVTE
ncbi:cupredoxin domain-containing protein [Halosolutus gelatinilyticus]|uniref:cupredoxin domain-containing protein n=1 Tax=Halosolutus gelatinilyticus TaxID=2931975 RepID=UPI001FF5FDF0|nr:plastocyanin/azurin family copper-binding protein [Halosolutus gelatinilyticus]